MIPQHIPFNMYDFSGNALHWPENHEEELEETVIGDT